jgi:hypothetical protein
LEEDVKKSICDLAEKTSKETDVTDDEIDRIMYRTWYRYDLNNYSVSILGSSTIPGFGRGAPFNEQDLENTEKANSHTARIRAEWKAPRKLAHAAAWGR